MSHQFVIRQRRGHNYPLHLVANLDESTIQFDMLSNQTVTAIGTKTVKIRTTGKEKNCLTVILACAGDGSKLKSLVIFKRKTMPEIQNKHGVVMAVQEKGWIDKVWHSHIRGLGRRRSLFVFNSFEVHRTEEIKCLLKTENTDLAIIPTYLPAADLRRLFKQAIQARVRQRVRQKWMACMAEGIHELTATEDKRNHLKNFCVSGSARRGVTPREMVARLFLKCGITNSLDGSEDDFVYDFSSHDKYFEDDALLEELFASDFEGF